MFSKVGLLCSSVIILAVTGCTATDPSFGESVHYAKAVQTIDPDPVYGPDDAQPGSSGEKAAGASKRYRSDAVKETQSVQTTSGGPG